MKGNIYIILLLSFSLLISCGKKDKNAQASNSGTNPDSCLTIALLPTLDCLPVYKAIEIGIFEKEGIVVHVKMMKSQFDAENYVIKNKADGCITDLFRTTEMQGKKIPIRFLLTTKRINTIVTNRMLRINKLKFLNERMIGSTRHSIPDYICDVVTNEIRKELATSKIIDTAIVLRPQINRIYLRNEMLKLKQLDAAIMPEPWGMIAANDGNKVIATYKDYNFSGFAFNTKQYKKKYDLIQKFVKSYNEAVDSLVANNELVISNNSAKLFAITEITDTIVPTEHFSHLKKVTTEQKTTVIEFAKRRNLVNKAYSGDTLTY